VHYLHFIVGALHRDIKPENFGFTQPIAPGQPLPRMKLMDFGSAWVLPTPVTQKTASLLLNLPPTGTEQYIAPECFERRSGPQSDVWGVGVIVHMLLCMDLPFGLRQCHPSEYKKAICQNQLSFTAKPWRVRSELAKNFTELLLDKNPTNRVNTLTALDNPWLRVGCEDNSDLFPFDRIEFPPKAISKRDVLSHLSASLDAEDCPRRAISMGL